MACNLQDSHRTSFVFGITSDRCFCPSDDEANIDLHHLRMVANIDADHIYPSNTNVPAKFLLRIGIGALLRIWVPKSFEIDVMIAFKEVIMT